MQINAVNRIKVHNNLCKQTAVFFVIISVINLFTVNGQPDFVKTQCIQISTKAKRFTYYRSTTYVFLTYAIAFDLGACNTIVSFLKSSIEENNNITVTNKNI